MHAYAKTAFRYLGVDYPFGNFDVADDTLARAMVLAGYIVDATVPGGTGGTVSFGGTPDGTKFLGDDLTWKVVPASMSPFSTTLLNAVTGTNPVGPSFTYPGGGSANFDISCANWNGAVATLQRSTDGGTTWTAMSGEFSAFTANGGCVVNETTNVKVRVSVQGTLGAAMTATLSR